MIDRRRPRHSSLISTNELTSRELDVVELAAMGLTNFEISEILFLSRETIKGHIRHILAKMNARSRAHMIHLAWHRGLLSTTCPERFSGHFAESQ